MFNINYLYFLIFFIFCLLISVVFILIPFLLAPIKPYKAKVSAYECGFQSNITLFYSYNVHFYLVAMLFLIFDVEILFILPWCLMINSNNYFSFWIIIIFLLILAVGFIYEWNKNALYLKK